MYEKDKGIVNKASWLKKAIVTLYALVRRQGVQQGAYYSTKKALAKLEDLRKRSDEILEKAINNPDLSLSLILEVDKIADEFVEVWVGTAYDVVPLEDTIEAFMKSQAL